MWYAARYQSSDTIALRAIVCKPNQKRLPAFPTTIRPTSSFIAARPPIWRPPRRTFCARRHLDLECSASQTRIMAHSYIRLDFGTDEEKAQQARHKLDGWRQAFRLDKKLQYKLDRPESS